MGHPNSCVAAFARSLFGSTGDHLQNKRLLGVSIEWNLKLNVLKDFKRPTSLQLLVGTVGMVY